MLKRIARVREPASPRSFFGHAIAKLWLVRAYSPSIWGLSAWRKQAQRVLLRLSDQPVSCQVKQQSIW